MKFTLKTGSALQQKTPCLVIGVFAGKYKEEMLRQLEPQLAGVFKRAIKSKEFAGLSGETLLMHGGGDSVVERILLVGLGKEGDFSLRSLRQISSGVVKFLTEKQLDTFLLTLPQVALKKTTFCARVQAVAEGVLLADYRYDRYLPARTAGQAVSLRCVELLMASDEDKEMVAVAVASAEAIVAGVGFARDLVNAPGNLKSPEYLAMQAVAMAEQVGISATLLDRREMERQGFGALLGVAQGSVRDPYLIVLEYRGGNKGDQPIALVGKGVTFDSGGISLKPGEKMDEMKMDMGGAATVLGTMQAAAQLQLPINLVAVVPTVENMPSGTAIRPGDILTSLSGKTIEVMNTDAEGRLILADALTYVERFKPCEVIDLATLTGACIIALGNQAAAILGNNDPLIQRIIKAGERSGERFWQLPLWDEYSEQIKSNFADVKNTGGRAAGTITAAAFLQKFAADYKWAHLDIAGMAWAEQGKAGQPKGGTGFGVRALIEYLHDK